MRPHVKTCYSKGIPFSLFLLSTHGDKSSSSYLQQKKESLFEFQQPKQRKDCIQPMHFPWQREHIKEKTSIKNAQQKADRYLVSFCTLDVAELNSKSYQNLLARRFSSPIRWALTRQRGKNNSCVFFEINNAIVIAKHIYLNQMYNTMSHKRHSELLKFAWQ